MLNPEIVRYVSLARHLFELGAASLRTSNDLHLFSAANLLQDSVEIFLIGIAEHVGASIDQNTKFERYFVLVDEKIQPTELPFKTKLLRLNRVRVSAKHHAIQPTRDECERLSVAVREFFDEVSTSVLGVSFATVSTIDLLRDGPTKEALLEAKQCFEAGQHVDCAIACRKAVYLEIEMRFDISAFLGDVPPGLLLSAMCEAPPYARSKEYIERHVAEPTDFIVYDRSSINQRLMTMGAETNAFWNLLRMTPKLFRQKNGTWIVKHEYGKLDAIILKETIDYIFRTAVDIVLSIHRTLQATQSVPGGKYYIDLPRGGLTLYKKADRNSVVVGHIPADMFQVVCDYHVTGLKGDGLYWHVSDMTRDEFIFGFLPAEALDTPND